MKTADFGIEALRQAADTVIVIPNQNLFRIADAKTTFADAFMTADRAHQRPGGEGEGDQRQHRPGRGDVGGQRGRSASDTGATSERRRLSIIFQRLMARSR